MTNPPPQEPTGLYDKFDVQPTDPAKRAKHADCDYFTLDLTHDKAARAAVQAYIGATEDAQLAADLQQWLDNYVEAE